MQQSALPFRPINRSGSRENSGTCCIFRNLTDELKIHVVDGAMVEKRRRKSAVKAPERSTLSLVLGDANALGTPKLQPWAPRPSALPPAADGARSLTSIDFGAGLWVFLSSINEEVTPGTH